MRSTKPPEYSTTVQIDQAKNVDNANEDSKAAEIDPWSLPELADVGVPWSGMLIRFIL